MAKTFLQVRTDEEIKEQASRILDELGTNLSSVVNLLLHQIVLTKSIPFEIKLPQRYTDAEVISEVQASFAMEDMPLTDEDVELLETYQKGTRFEQEQMLERIIEEYQE